MKRIVCLLLVLCMMVSLAGCVEEIVGSAVFLFLVATGDDRADKEDIFTFVCENEADLLAAIDSGISLILKTKALLRT